MTSLALTVASLSTGHEIALAAMGAIFIAFALASSFLFPRANPNFPGRAMPWFVVGAATFFLAMLAAVLVFGVEQKKAEGATAETTAATTSEGTPTTTTESTSTTTTSGSGEKIPAQYANGDATAGKAVFTGSAGCSGCHTLKAAGSKGTIGPNLDQAMPDRSLIVTRVTLGKPPMPAFKGILADKQIADVVAFVYSSTH